MVSTRRGIGCYIVAGGLFLMGLSLLARLPAILNFLVVPLVFVSFLVLGFALFGKALMSAILGSSRLSPARWGQDFSDLFAGAMPLDVSPIQETDAPRIAAERALRRAGQSVRNSEAQLTDIGLLVYEGRNEPHISRLGDVPTNATHIRPFVVYDLSAAAVTSAAGTIRFNLIDAEGRLRYTVRSRYTLKRGINFITPPTWLPLNEQNPDGVWSLQINVGDGAPIAIHEFKWFEIGGELRAAFTGDGEIDDLMKDVIEQHTAPEETVSLDELLGEQGEIAPTLTQARH